MINAGKILVAYADDHNMFRKLLVKHLESDDRIKVILQGTDGADLLAQISGSGILPDVCLIDINMPNMGGLELLCKIRKEWPSVKCIILTAFNDDTKIITMISHGANGYLIKNSDPEVVIMAIKEAYVNGCYYSDVANSRMFRMVLTQKIKVDTFSEIEIAIMKYCCTSLTYPEIANELGIGFRSLDAYREKLFSKLEINSRIGIAIAAIKLGFHSIN